MIHVVAVITTKPGQRQEVLKHFHAIVPDVRAEKGCIEYIPVVDAQTEISVQKRYGLDTFVVIEKSENVEALDAHGVAPHMAAYAGKTKEMVVGRAIYVMTGA